MSCDSALKSATALIGRILISLIFLCAGVQKLMAFKASQAMVAGAGLPYAHILLIVAIVVEIGAGVMLVFGWNARLGALALFVFTLVVTFTFHTFWTYESAEMANQMQHFLKNFAMLGGLLYIMAYGPGCWSVSGCKACKKNNKEPSSESTQS